MFPWTMTVIMLLCVFVLPWILVLWISRDRIQFGSEQHSVELLIFVTVDKMSVPTLICILSCVCRFFIKRAMGLPSLSSFYNFFMSISLLMLSKSFINLINTGYNLPYVFWKLCIMLLWRHTVIIQWQKAQLVRSDFMGDFSTCFVNTVRIFRVSGQLFTCMFTVVLYSPLPS